ncbi:hypothetical protein Csa_012173 [Cucumis sativus]|uniref:Uncharacterized protein n=1 Tax=Cucumis sativus TaxID=3659 RepID=A0A0A0L0U8_CUCSA|nr:hypothetical protein Csa_012173 [Cucumis sativus]
MPASSLQIHLRFDVVRIHDVVPLRSRSVSPGCRTAHLRSNALPLRSHQLSNYLLFSLFVTVCI